MRLFRFTASTLAVALLTACSAPPTSPFPPWTPLADIVPDPSNPERLTYTFDELQESCGLFVTTTGLYEDLGFPSTANLSRCITPNGTIGLMPSAPLPGSIEIGVLLPRDAFAVSLESFLFDPGNAPTLVAYDANGTEIGQASDGTEDVWATLTVEAGGPAIREIGLLMPQGVVFLDNLTVTYALPPGPGPATKDDCDGNGWEAFGFRNHGQCVRFLRMGQDSR